MCSKQFKTYLKFIFSQIPFERGVIGFFLSEEGMKKNPHVEISTQLPKLEKIPDF